jgi:hypothetical protein
MRPWRCDTARPSALPEIAKKHALTVSEPYTVGWEKVTPASGRLLGGWVDAPLQMLHASSGHNRVASGMRPC